MIFFLGQAGLVTILASIWSHPCLLHLKVRLDTWHNTNIFIETTNLLPPPPLLFFIDVIVFQIYGTLAYDDCPLSSNLDTIGFLCRPKIQFQTFYSTIRNFISQLTKTQKSIAFSLRIKLLYFFISFIMLLYSVFIIFICIYRKSWYKFIHVH